MKSGVTSVAYEMVTQGRRLPLLEPMSEIAGRMSVIVGAYFLAKHTGAVAFCSVASLVFFQVASSLSEVDPQASMLPGWPLD